MPPTSPPIPRLETRSAGFEQAFQRFERRREQQREQVDETVAAILADVRQRGDDAVLDAIERYDGYRLEPGQLVVSDAEIDAGSARLPAADRDALRAAAERIRRFHSAHLPASWRIEKEDEVLGQELRPLARVGMYVPAAKAPLASSTLMIAVPARVAGVEELVMSTPAREVHPAILASARLGGVTRLLRVGGAQAVAALAYGTESIPRVDKIVGPGNVWVQAAKRQVYGEVDIDGEAGPSEVWIVADADAPAHFVAADLLAQAEHEERAGVVLASPSEELLGSVSEHLERLLADLPRRDIAARALREQGALILTRNVEEAVELGNRYAPEHLQLMLHDAERWLARVRNAGAVFLGSWSPVPIGDYVAGPSHVLPTGGTARFSSPLGVEDFVRRVSLIQLGPSALARCGPDAVRLAELEGLHGHARSVQVRLAAVLQSKKTGESHGS